MFFENMGITYLGPVDGTNIKEIRKVLAEAKRVRGPVLVHVRTIKGEGYLPAERHPARFHGTGPFDIDTGVPLYHQEKRITRMCFPPSCAKWGSGSRRWLRLPQRWQTEPV